MTEYDDRIVELLDRWLKRDLYKDSGHGYRHTKIIAGALGITPTTCREILERLATQARIKKIVFSNGLAWRSVNPLPWERGGELEESARHEVKIVITGHSLSTVDAEAIRIAVAEVIKPKSWTANALNITSVSVDSLTNAAR